MKNKNLKNQGTISFGSTTQVNHGGNNVANGNITQHFNKVEVKGSKNVEVNTDGSEKESILKRILNQIIGWFK